MEFNEIVVLFLKFIDTRKKKSNEDASSFREPSKYQFKQLSNCNMHVMIKNVL